MTHVALAAFFALAALGVALACMAATGHLH